MSVKIIEKKQEEKKYNYPLAFKLVDYDTVVLFSALTKGTVVKTASSLSLNDDSEEWDEHTDSSVWEPVDITICHD